jgi:hypothetical protein
MGLPKCLGLAFVASLVAVIGCGRGGGKASDLVVAGGGCSQSVWLGLGEARYRTGKWVQSKAELESIVPNIRKTEGYDECRGLRWEYMSGTDDSDTRSVGVFGVDGDLKFGNRSGSFGRTRGSEWGTEALGIGPDGEDALVDDEENAAVSVACEVDSAREKTGGITLGNVEAAIGKIVDEEFGGRYKFAPELVGKGEDLVLRLTSSTHVYEFPIGASKYKPMTMTRR